MKPQGTGMRNAGFRRMLGAALCGLVLVLGGCDGDDTAVEIGPTLFEFDRYLTGYTAVDTYPWDTTLRQAFVTTTLQGFTGGSLTVRLYDGSGTGVSVRANGRRPRPPVRWGRWLPASPPSPSSARRSATATCSPSPS